MANYFWVGGSGTWDSSSTTHWATSSGGAGSAGVPTSSDTATMDSLSNATGYTLTIGSAATCSDVVFGKPLTGNITIAGSNQISIDGNATWVSGNTTITYSGGINFTSTATGKTITTAGNSPTSGNMTFTGVGGGWTLQDALTIGGSIILTNGTLDTNGKAISNTQLASNNSNTRTLTLGASQITCTTATAINFSTTTGLTLNAGTSKIICSGNGAAFNGNGLTWYDVDFSSVNQTSITIQGYSGHTLIFGDLSAVNLRPVILSGNITLTDTITVGSSARTRRASFRSDTFGTQRTISMANAPTFASASDFRDISVTGAASPVAAANCGNGGNNSGITFDSPVNWFCVATAGSVSYSDNIWSTSSGGSITNGIMPTSQDTIVIDENSLCSTLLINKGWNIGGISASTRTTALTISKSGSNMVFSGNITFGSGITFSGAGVYFLGGGSAQSIDFAGKTAAQDCTIQTYSTVSLATAFGNGNLILTSGTFDANGQNVTITTFTASGSLTRTLTIGSGTWSLTSTGTVWNITATGLTINGGTTGKIAFTDTSTTAKTFTGGGFSYPILEIGGATGIATYNFDTGNTFWSMTSVKTVASTLSFANGSTTTITSSWLITGTSGNVITLQRASSGIFTLVKTYPRNVSVNFLSISNSTASPNFIWYAGANSTDGGGNTGWVFSTPTSTLGQMFQVF